MSEEIADVVEKRKVEVTEANGIREGADHYEFEDRVTVPKAIADKWISLGWAKCVATGEQGERVAGVNKLETLNAIQQA